MVAASIRRGKEGRNGREAEMEGGWIVYIDVEKCGDNFDSLWITYIHEATGTA